MSRAWRRKHNRFAKDRALIVNEPWIESKKMFFGVTSRFLFLTNYLFILVHLKIIYFNFFITFCCVFLYSKIYNFVKYNVKCGNHVNITGSFLAWFGTSWRSQVNLVPLSWENITMWQYRWVGSSGAAVAVRSAYQVTKKEIDDKITTVVPALFYSVFLHRIQKLCDRRYLTS